MGLMSSPLMIQADENLRLWGASVFSYPNLTEAELLSALAKEGIRAWIIPARAGASGYLALIAHPEDLHLFAQGPIISGNRETRERWIGDIKIRLVRFSRADFPIQAQAVGDNLREAFAPALARDEKEALNRLMTGASAQGRGNWI